MNHGEVEQATKDKDLTAPRLTMEQIEGTVVSTEFYIFPNSQMTVCCLTLVNGFNVTGYSACASPENFDKDIGEGIALRNAIDQIWALEGYLLKQKLYTGEVTNE